MAVTMQIQPTKKAARASQRSIQTSLSDSLQLQKMKIQ